MALIDVNRIEKQGGGDTLKKHLSRHRHGPSQFEVIYIKDGEGLFFNGELYKPFSPGSLILIPPETPHQIQPERLEDPLLFYSLLLQTEDHSVRDNLHSLVPRFNPMSVGLPWHPFFEDMTLRHNNPHPLMNAAGYHRVLSLLFELPALEHQAETRPEKNPLNQHLTRALEYMERRLYQALTLKDLCRDIQISEEYLIRLFRRHLDTTPMKYLTRLRISTARMLLEETDMSMKEISWKLKFTDQYHFSRVFKQASGMTPSQYRNSRERLPSPDTDRRIIRGNRI